jgi:putative ABC transport system permease protein
MPFRHAIRIFTKHPGFAALAAGTLASGIGLAAAFASVADAILFRPLPVARPSEIVRVYTASRLQPLGYVSYPDYEDLSRNSRTLAGMVAQSQVLLAVGTGTGESLQVRMGLAVTPNYFDVLDVRAALGRTFRPEDARVAAVVLSGGFWRSRYGGDRRILGRAVEIGGAPFTVIGVAPPGFGLDRFVQEDYYIPIGVYGTGLLPSAGSPLTDRTKRYLSVFARRAAPIPAVQAELNALAARLEAEYPDADRGRRTVVLSELAARLQSDKTMPAIAAVLLALAALTLAIACANVSGLLVLRGEARTAEVALCAAMGAGPLRLLGEVTAESLGLAVAGMAMAMPLAWGAVRLLARSLTLPTDLPLSIDARIDAHIWVLAACAATLAALMCGLAPWCIVRRITPAAALRRSGSARVSGASRLRNALVLTQIALASALAVSGAELLEGMLTAGRVDLGYRIDHVLAMAFDPAQMRADEARTRGLYRELLDRVRQLPGVKATALAQSVPLGLTGAQRQVKINDADRGISVWMNTVSPGYFELMRMAVIAGRVFNDRDTENSPRVAIVNQAMAKLWPASGALGHRMEVNGQTIEIVGVVRTAKYFEVSEGPRPYFYLPYAQNYASRMVLHVETAGSPAGAAPAVLAAARVIDATQPVSEIRSLEQYFSQGALFGARIGLLVTASAGGCALLLALTGLYGSVARTVQRRRREIGIRAALGANHYEILRMVLGHGAKLALAGTVAGSAAALAAGPWLTKAVASERANGVGVLALAALMVIMASLAACLIPALRAARVDPAVALRQE